MLEKDQFIQVTLLLIVIVSYLGHKIHGEQQNQLKKLIQKVAQSCSQDYDDVITQISENIQGFFQDKVPPLLPQQQKQKEKKSQSNFIIRHYEKFFIAQYSNQTNLKSENSVQIKCQTNEILYAKKFIDNNSDSFTGEGFQYKVTYDNNLNPNYELYEGQFLNGLKHGIGKLYGQKSENVYYEGEWKNDKMVSQRKEKFQTDQLERQSLIKFIIRDGDQIVSQNKRQIEKRKRVDDWIKYNQQISEHDIDRLQSKSKWFTSSIIDSFALYLNIKMEEKYFQIDPNERRQALRQVFIPSQIFTSMQNEKKDGNQEIFQKHFLEYKIIEYKIEKIFDRVNFIVNRNNAHWFLIQLNLRNYEMVVMDSLKNKHQYYNFAKDILNQIFDNKIKRITLSNQCHVQKNGNDCGPYTCIHMLEISEIQSKLRNPSEMRDFLLSKLKQD
ncbi:unnamed protein product (macronuclear) [Paramecium tetraurelia]|uniref:Ubiquitin-like protease family profile domain-containing protein n=1 Tax=Paramecium tetraurelia TaxID=5888 RepID=A0E7Q8_PARTE|nr:uncharacterized protein GSPATT00024053001 [Paramecium tetraurelia]CAK91325.1 unnamed protein product [Paramecium tetraurelia]|eukprot:XP_001458722.1 hypothetical protein (macronuclear) [Paramecium tetraurelia strain d4-2]